ncbi:hypothetical protein FOZ61_002149, partial [Perkinsus olseni]
LERDRAKLASDAAECEETKKQLQEDRAKVVSEVAEYKKAIQQLTQDNEQLKISVERSNETIENMIEQEKRLVLDSERYMMRVDELAAENQKLTQQGEEPRRAGGGSPPPDERPASELSQSRKRSSSSTVDTTDDLDPMMFQTPLRKTRRCGRRDSVAVSIIDGPKGSGEKGVLLENKAACDLKCCVFFDGQFHCEIEVQAKGEYCFVLDSNLRERYPGLKQITVQSLVDKQLQVSNAAVPLIGRYSVRRRKGVAPST